MITQTNDVQRHFEALGMKVKIHKPHRGGPLARHTIEFMPGGKIALDRFESLVGCYFNDVRPHSTLFDCVTVRLNEFNADGDVNTGACIKCGCTEHNACLDPLTGGCWWIEPGLCSMCVDDARRQASIQEFNQEFKDEEK